MIRKAILSDLNDICLIEEEVFKDDIFKLSRASLRYHLLKNQLFIYEKEKKTVAYILWLKRKSYFRLYSIAILKEAQGLGISSKLLEYSFENLDLDCFTLEVRIDNIKALNLYKKFGFEQVKILKDYYSECDGVFMKKCKA